MQSAEQQWRPYVAVSERRRKWGECGEQAWLGTCVTRHEQKVKRELREWQQALAGTVNIGSV